MITNLTAQNVVTDKADIYPIGSASCVYTNVGYKQDICNILQKTTQEL
jgi:hypothetical protein